MADLPSPIAPYLEPAAKERCEAADPHPLIYEVPPEKGRDILLGLRSDESVPRPDVDEEWADVDAGRWGTVRTRIIRPEGGRSTVRNTAWTPRGSPSPVSRSAAACRRCSR